MQNQKLVSKNRKCCALCEFLNEDTLFCMNHNGGTLCLASEIKTRQDLYRFGTQCKKFKRGRDVLPEFRFDGAVIMMRMRQVFSDAGIDTFEKLYALRNYCYAAANLKHFELKKSIRAIAIGDIVETVYDGKAYRGKVTQYYHRMASGIVFEIKTSSKKYPFFECGADELRIISQRAR